MLRPSASRTYSSAMSMMRTQALPAICTTNGRANRRIAPMIQAASWLRLARSIMGAPYGLRPVPPSGSEPLRTAERGSCAVGDAFAQQALRPERQHQDEDDEGEDVLVVAAEDAAGEIADVAGAERFDQAEQDAADHRAGEVADAAEDRRRERLQAGQEAHRVLHRAVVGGVHD